MKNRFFPPARVLAKRLSHAGTWTQTQKKSGKRAASGQRRIQREVPLPSSKGKPQIKKSGYWEEIGELLSNKQPKKKDPKKGNLEHSSKGSKATGRDQKQVRETTPQAEKVPEASKLRSSPDECRGTQKAGGEKERTPPSKERVQPLKKPKREDHRCRKATEEKEKEKKLSPSSGNATRGTFPVKSQSPLKRTTRGGGGFRRRTASAEREPASAIG